MSREREEAFSSVPQLLLASSGLVVFRWYSLSCPCIRSIRSPSAPAGSY